ncbi:MAG TPA: L-2-hydroxyglutarate oxidase [Aggregatilineales bacterium]|nr:L-2-hydroxyglutarate oxidase [Aggregatilineales bacterium]
MQALTEPGPQRTHYDMVIVGGGIVGLATAREILRQHPDLKLALLEKEIDLAHHQSGHNSGVIHSGLYYKPGSMKAKLCVAGHDATIAFCQENHIPYDLCGKVVVALTEDEVPRLSALYERGIANGVQGLSLIESAQLRELEPHAAGVKAIYSPNTGVVDYKQIAGVMAQDIQHRGGEIVAGCKVLRIDVLGDVNRITFTMAGQAGVQGRQRQLPCIEARFVITCAGLFSDVLARGRRSDRSQPVVRIIPFRGDYYVLRPEKRHLTHAMIYPLPDPAFPFLGVHFTRRMDGEVWVGPNAVLAFAREGYTRTTIRWRELAGVLSFPGFWKLAAKYWRTGFGEMYRDYVKSAYVKDARRYIPELSATDLLPGPSGVRAQALSAQGELVDDFLFAYQKNVIHVQNAPSPAATSALVIGKMIAQEARQRFVLPGTSDSPVS